jgi:hypothetical protein
VASVEQKAILAGMALCWRDVADAAVTALVVVPLHETNRPLPRGIQIGKPP